MFEEEYKTLEFPECLCPQILFNTLLLTEGPSLTTRASWEQSGVRKMLSLKNSILMRNPEGATTDQVK